MAAEKNIVQLRKRKSSPSSEDHIIVQPSPPISVAADFRDVQKSLYRRVLEIVATVEDHMQHWMIVQTIFEYVLFHFNKLHGGLVVRYARVGPEHADGIHTLHEVAMYGTPPWSATSQGLLYWGSTHLAGWAATRQHMQVWDVCDRSQRMSIDVDEYEQSICAHPVTRAGLLAGVLQLSSTQPGFFSHPLTRQAVHEYALLLALAFRPQEFKPFSCLHLRVMPDLLWQRSQMERWYVERVLKCVRQGGLPREEAEALVRREMELEFEQQGCLRTIPL